MGDDNEKTVTAFCQAIEGGDIEEILGFFADGAVYHNMPMEPAVGADAIRALLGMFVSGPGSVGFEVLAMASAGDVVFTERVDRLTFGGREVELPVAGVFEVRDGKITAWRDYFDMAAFTG
ncbi:MAG: limonene,2-epoxide hydrolase [Acidimicrobiales bacterium]|jgi:limonene-1,2-epoxide hydrolase|nr:limonene,2-epoxide hydrolase [Acidimicrobiales bacterium]